MTPKQMLNLKPGDIVTNYRSGMAYVVTANYEGRITAVRTVDITTPSLWGTRISVKPRKMGLQRLLSEEKP